MKTQTKRITQALIAAGILLGSNFALADDREVIENLRALVQELDQKIKVLDQNLEEIRGACQDALEDAVLMGCDEEQIRAVLCQVVAGLVNPYKTN